MLHGATFIGNARDQPAELFLPWDADALDAGRGNVDNIIHPRSESVRPDRRAFLLTGACRYS